MGSGGGFVAKAKTRSRWSNSLDMREWIIQNRIDCLSSCQNLVQRARRASSAELLLATELLVIAGPDEGRQFRLQEGDALSLGRGRSAAVSLRDPSVKG
jgi:hypothetical protein